MAKVSIDNGFTFCDSAEELLSELDPYVDWEKMFDCLVQMMDDTAMETVHSELAPCTDFEFLDRYLEIAPCDLILG